MVTLDLAGVGIGPFNLSLAALLSHAARPEQPDGLTYRFFEQKPSFSWHPGMMLPGAKLQTSCLKDLVTPILPTSPFSFVNYLVTNRRIYDYLSGNFEETSRLEFSDYLAWAAAHIAGLDFGQKVLAVEDNGDAFALRFSNRPPIHARHLTVGTGTVPAVPDCATPYLGERCFHASRLLTEPRNLTGKTVAVIGGGQTGAEVFLHSLQGTFGQPAKTVWLSRRATFEPLDETPFTNGYFTPGYVSVFHGLPLINRQTSMQAQKLASDGISPVTLKQIYEAVYEQYYIAKNADSLALMPGRELIDMEDQRQGSRGFKLTARNGLSGETETCFADVVILCTGFTTSLPDCLGAITDRLALDGDGHVILGRHYQAQWDGPSDRRIYVQNGGRQSHGIADPQLSLMAWRSAVIINHLFGHTVFDTSGGASLLHWASDEGSHHQESPTSIDRREYADAD